MQARPFLGQKQLLRESLIVTIVEPRGKMFGLTLKGGVESDFLLLKSMVM